MRLAVVALLVLGLAHAVAAHSDNTHTFEFGSLSVTDGPEGFILYCPCIGRFGAQVDSLFGALALAKNVNRTLVLPPFVIAGRNNENLEFVPFESLFEVGPVLGEFNVITMADFMRLHGSRWNPRVGHCFRREAQLYDAPKCNHKTGRPFGPFWAYSKVDFDWDQYLPTDLVDWSPSSILKWDAMVPRTKVPYIALPTAPAEIPARPEHWYMQRVLVWRAELRDAAASFIDKNLHRPFVAVHMRNGPDWVKACSEVEGKQSFLSSPQCPAPASGLTRSMCLPSFPLILQRVRQAVSRSGARSFFVLTDNNGMDAVFANELSIPTVSLSSSSESSLGALPFLPVSARPFLDLIIATESDYFVGNCISSFSAFVKRARDVQGKPTIFLATTD